MKQYLTPQAIARIGSLQVVARMVVEGALSGHHKSPFFGFNIEFAEHRPYLPGDELRHVDWKYFAKTDEYFVKQYEESTSLKAFLLLDRSRSMRFGGGALDKLEYARYLTAALAYLMIHQQDHVGLATFSTGLETLVAPRAHPQHLHRLLEGLEADDGPDQTDMFAVFRELAKFLKRRHLVVVVSDFLDDMDRLLDGVRFLKGLDHEVVLLQVLSPEELDFPYEGLVEFTDLETPDDRLILDTSTLRARYQEEIERFRRELTERARSMRVDLECFRTDEAMEERLGTFLQRRARGRR